jgi:8-oxo-dGTP pyrophosphatase MutT (NUDIX family)
MKLGELVEGYLAKHPDERSGLGVLLGQVAAGENLISRTNYTGHVTTSGLILSPDHKKVLLIYHPTFERWMQPGGHLEPEDAGPWAGAERESLEETGFKIGRRLWKADHLPFLIESHLVPTKPPKNEPEHYHHSFWYGFVAESEELKLEDIVIKQASWLSFDKVQDPKVREALQRIRALV